MQKSSYAVRGHIALVFVLVSTGLMKAQNVAPTQKYQQLVTQLSSRIKHEMQDKQIPSVAIALVNNQKIVWAQGFGWQNNEKAIPATAHTVYRVGSVSKLFTDIGVMQLVQSGKVNLDAPVTRYIPDFSPRNPFRVPITLRELMSHRSGLVREPPIGNYFDDSGPTLQQTILSLNKTTLVYAPGTQTKYSNAGVAVVGYVLQTLGHGPYADYLQKAVLVPMGMTESSFQPEPALIKNLATAYMWSYDGLRFVAPTFQLGEGPCGAMYTTVIDLSKFLSVLFAEGRSSGGTVLQPKTLQSMWTPQFDSRSSSSAFGIGFFLQNFEGHPEVGHNGNIYGFSTQLAALPDEKIGVVVITTLDSTNAVADQIVRAAMKGMLSVRAGLPLAQPAFSHALPRELAFRLDGRYANGGNILRLQDQGGEVYLANLTGGSMVSMREKNDQVIRDGRLGYSPDSLLAMPAANNTAPASIHFNHLAYSRIASPKPPDVSAAWQELIGEYGWDYDKLYILEKNGKLTALIEWFEFDPLRQISTSVFEFPGRGLYLGENATFVRDPSGKVTAVKVGEVTFPRLPTNPHDKIFQIQPLKPVSELRRVALLAKPPKESGDFRKPELVDVTKLDPTIRLDIRYATNRDFLSSPMYTEARAFMQRPAAEALVQASHALHAQGYGLLIHDAYRPWYVTKMFWDGTPDDKKIFVANPSEGSRHNRGCAVDITLYNLVTGKQLVMTGGYDEMSERSYPYYPGGTSLERWDRDVLRKAMESAGFTVYQYEWWHFDYKDWRLYPILNLTFEELDKQQTASI